VLFDPWIQDGKKSGSRISITDDHISKSYQQFFELKKLKFYDADQDPG
jgi:hypothetical protein